MYELETYEPERILYAESFLLAGREGKLTPELWKEEREDLEDEIVPTSVSMNTSFL